MKWSKLASLASTTFLGLVACTESADQAPSDMEGESEIESMERDSGLVLHKEDLTFRVSDGKVVLRVASANESALRHHLGSSDISVTPLYEDDRNYARRPANVNSPSVDSSIPGLNGDLARSRTEPSHRIFYEIVDSDLGEGIVGHSITTQPKDNVSGSMTAGAYADTIEYISGTWPELAEVFGASMQYKFMGKSRWYSGWSTRTFCEIYSPYICAQWRTHDYDQIRWIDVDGPYKVKAVVSYTGHSGVIFYNH